MGRQSKRRRHAKAAERAKRKQPKGPTRQAPLQPTKQLHQRLFQAAKWAIGVALAFGGAVGTVDQIWGPIWPTNPIVMPSGSDPGSPFSLPFSAKNRSVIFSYWSADFGCAFKNIYGHGGQPFMSDITFVFGHADQIGPDADHQFSCGVSVPKDFVTSAEMRIQIKYQIRFFGLSFPKSYVSEPFVWMKTTDGGRWVFHQ